jgi:hypothetical protein
VVLLQTLPNVGHGGATARARSLVGFEHGDVAGRERRLRTQQVARNPTPTTRRRGASIERRKRQKAGETEEPGAVVIVEFHALEHVDPRQVRGYSVHVGELPVDVVEIRGWEIEP